MPASLKLAATQVPLVFLLLTASSSIDSVCSRTDVWRGLTQREAHNRGIERAKTSVKLVARDAANDLEKWSTSLGDFWLPAEMRSVLPILLSRVWAAESAVLGRAGKVVF